MLINSRSLLRKTHSPGGSSSQKTRVIITATENCSENIARCTIPDDLFITRNFLYSRSDSGVPTAHGKIGVCVCWTNGSVSGRLTCSVERRFYFIHRHRVASAEKKAIWRRQYSAWRRSSAATPLRIGCYVATANRGGHEAPEGGDGIEFWDKSLSRRRVEIIAKVR